MNEILLSRAITKAKSSNCRYKIAAIGLNKKGDIVGIKNNTFRLPHKGGGHHAEMRLMKQYRNKIKTIIICRTNNKGELLPIEPCESCSKTAEKLGIKIKTIKD